MCALAALSCDHVPWGLPAQRHRQLAHAGGDAGGVAALGAPGPPAPHGDVGGPSGAERSGAGGTGPGALALPPYFWAFRWQFFTDGSQMVSTTI